jgi:hypothetical protein
MKRMASVLLLCLLCGCVTGRKWTQVEVDSTTGVKSPVRLTMHIRAPPKIFDQNSFREP